MEEREQRAETVTFWDNVRRMVQIHMIQQKQWCIYSVLVIGIMFLIITVSVLTAFIYRAGIQKYYVLSGYGGCAIVGYFIMLGRSHTLLANEHISMYPGNTMSRYLSRVLVDHGFMLVYTLFFGLFYILQSGVFWLFLHGRSGVDISQLFDIRYLGLGMLRIYLIWMMVYGILAVFYAIVAKWGFKALVGMAGVLVAGLWYMALRYPDQLVRIKAWWVNRTSESTNIVSYAGVCLVVWLFCMFVTTMIASGIHVWKKSNPGVYGVIWTSLIFVYAGALFIIAGNREDGTVLLGNVVSYDRMECLRSQALIKLPQNCAALVSNEPDSYSMVDQDGKKYGSVVEYFNVDYKYNVTSVSQAVEDGVIPEGTDLSGINDQYALYLYEIPNIQLHGHEIYRDFIDCLPESMIPACDSKQCRMEYRDSDASAIYNDCFPGVDRFLYHGKNDITMDDYYQNQPVWKVTVVLSDARYAELDGE